MKFDDFYKYFTSFEVCRVNDSFIYTYRKFKQENGQKFSFIKLLIQYEGEYYFTICQKDKRCFHSKPYKYSNARIIFCENKLIDGAENAEKEFGSLRYIESMGTANRDTNIHCQHLTPGEYFIYVEVDWNSDLAQREFVVSSYGVNETIFLEDDCGHHT